ncbi:MarR family transcriptional regulator [Thermobifida cellulosilytica TB100]|uniref:MarR family transcriptional regulator n=2 Tax=Thermobifida cellulosilytica TaxID=144786 RepID=A0A147KI11_THECS|nr:MarR family transcriptional regulator [Thermobifida cellulosilytica TB100]
MVLGSGSSLWNNPGYRLIKLGELVMFAIEQALAPLEVTPRQFNVLATAAALDSPSQQELSRALGIDPNVMVGLIDDLERSGIVERRRNPEDRRRYMVALTPHGKELLNSCIAVMHETEKRFFAPLADDEVAALNDAAGRLLTAHPRPPKRH